VNSVFDRHYKRYDAWYDRNKAVYLSELKAVKKALPTTGTGLEIGTGTGRFACALDIRYGVEPSKNMAAIARKRGVEVYLSYGGCLPFVDAIFDYAAIIITLCFVKNPKKVLGEAYRVLKKGGRIIIGIVDKDSFLGKFYLQKKSVFYKGASFFSVGDVTRLLQRAGFKGCSYYQTLFSPPGATSVVEKPRTGFGKGGFVVISATK
jgi:ubiquinone/menaquinone biosynthesis C-methylase UbiE